MGNYVGWAALLVAVGLGCSGGSAAPEPAAAAQVGQGSEATSVEVVGSEGLAEQLPNGAAPEPGIYTAGAPGPQELAAAERAGVRTVIDLRTAGEKSYDEASAVRELGMLYVPIEVAGAQGLTRKNVERLDAALQGEGPFLVHCGSANRTGALFALRAAWLQDKGEAEALEIGRAHGMTKLEPAVRALLAEPPPAAE